MSEVLCEGCDYCGTDGNLLHCGNRGAGDFGYIIVWKNRKRVSSSCPIAFLRPDYEGELPQGTTLSRVLNQKGASEIVCPHCGGSLKGTEFSRMLGTLFQMTTALSSIALEEHDNTSSADEKVRAMAATARLVLHPFLET